MGSGHKGVATLFFFKQRAVQDRGVAPLFRTCPGTKEAYLQEFPTRATAALQGAARKGVYIACVLVFVMHACMCLCRLWQRDQHDDMCLFVFVMHARSCLCRLLQHPCRKTAEINKGDGRSSRSRSSRGLQHSALELVDADPRVLTPKHFGVPLI